jgi:DNA mismatch repair protein MutS2
MDSKSRQTLELPKVLDQLAALAHFSASKELARRLAPTIELDQVRARLTATAEARQLLESNPEHTIGGARDVRPLTEQADRGLSLEPSDFLMVRDCLIAGRTQARFLAQRADQLPILGAMAEGIHIPEGLIDRISQVVDDRGEVRDSASDKLGAIRRQHKVVHERLTTKLQAMLADSKIAGLLQESLVTQREGRYVLPLRAEHKGKLKGIVHDQSSSGATLFVEPLTVVDLNNEARQLALDERDEIRRILAELSQRVGSDRLEIDGTVAALAEIDMSLAKARYAESLGAAAPDMEPMPRRGTDGRVRTVFSLFGARHPLLDQETVVPVDLVLEDGTRALVITGPNTGGKTVALKTAGLLTLMAQCGLHLPVEAGSQLSVFEQVFADIGDEQSIEQSLSTFSGHVANIVRVLEDADERSLVLLDELGAGTDPQEGASLAIAILQELLERGSTTLIATHYPELKTYAHVTDGVRNASVEFDLESLKPTYRLTLGLPGRSNALAIGERLGLPLAIIEQARRRLSPDDLASEKLLDEIHRQREAADRAAAAAEQARLEADEIRLELRQQRQGIEDERRGILDEARREARHMLETIQHTIETLRGKLTKAGQSLEAVEAAKAETESLAAPLDEPIERRRVEPAADPIEIRPGDRVYLATLGSEGVLAELGEREVEVQIGKLRIRAGRDEVRPVARTESEPSARPLERQVRVSVADGAPPSAELDLRGLTAEEAEVELERRLDAAFLAGLAMLRVIHGKGTGTLRQAVRRALDGSAYVASHRPGEPGEGGQGVTVVSLATG